METWELANIVVGWIVAVIGIVLTIYYARHSSRLEKERRRVSWDEVRSGSSKLRRDIQSGKVSNLIGSNEPRKRKRKFRPSVVFVPCRRGATVANLMFDTQENILLFMGVRLDKRRPNAETEAAKLRTDDWVEPHQTGKYYHFIPRPLIDMLTTNPDAKLLILDDYAESGNSMKEIATKIQEAAKLTEDNLRTAVLVCNKSAGDQGNHAPNFWWLENNYPDFYFPWGKSV